MPAGESAPDESLGLPKIQVQTRTDQVADQLMRYIEVADLGPGSKLPGEARLAEEFGVSRPVVREALRDLAGKGVIQVVNGRGAIVRPVEVGPLRGFFDRATLVGSDDTVLELMEVRRGLELTSAQLAAQRRSEADLGKLTELVESMAAAVDDEERYIDLDVEFHVQVASATDNRMLGFLVDSIRGALHRAVQRGLQPRHEHEEREVVQQLHEEILRAISNGDPVAAVEAMDRHFEVAIATIDRTSPSKGETAP